MKVLRIRENINLNDILPKLGFKQTAPNTYFKEVENSSFEEFESGILINPLNKVVENQIVMYFNNTDEIHLDEDDIDSAANLAQLYDLFPVLEVVEVESFE